MNSSSQTILLVDDDPAVRRFLQRAVKQLGYDVCTATDTESFQKAFKDCHPDIILLDLIIPGSDSMEMLKFLADFHCNVPVLLMSGLDGRTIRVAGEVGTARGLRMFGGLEKPLRFHVLEEVLARASHAQHRIAEKHLVNAIEQDELRVYYQPQVHPSGGELTGAEALLRWQHPERGMLSPDAFLPLARTPEVMRKLTRWVCDEALAQLGEWGGRGIDMTMSINLFTNDIMDESFPDWMEERVLEHHVDPSKVVLEVTERDAATDMDTVREVVTRLRLKGFQLSIDDFGTGYSSFAMLQQMPFGELKIDKCFVMEALTDSSSRAIVQALIGLGQSLGLRVVAEGVEDEPTLEFMRQLGISVIQGFHTGRPMPAKSFMHGYHSQRTSTLLA